MKKPGRFVFRWLTDDLACFTTVEIDFQPVKEGTLLTHIEYGYVESPNKLQNMLNRSAGWAQALTLMKFYVEHGTRY